MSDEPRAGGSAAVCLHKQHITINLDPVIDCLFIESMPYWFDGNNLIGQSADVSRKDRNTRNAFLSTLGRYRTAGGGRFLVFFDGDDPADSSMPTGIQVRYSAPESADAAMICRLREIQRPSEVIVVTNDMELQNRCRHAGANPLNWHQFTLKMQSRQAVTPSRRNHAQEEVDVEDWMRFFGMDSTDN